MEAIDKITYKGFTIELYPDTYTFDPRELAESELATWHGRYDIGERTSVRADRSDYLRHKISNATSFYSEEALESMSEDTLFTLLTRYYYWDHVYIYDHSGVSFSTRPFSCSWDSGWLGIISISKKVARGLFGVKDTGKLEKLTMDMLQGEIQQLDDIRNNRVVYTQVKDAEGNLLDCCGGYYPDHSKNYSDWYADPIKQCKANIDSHVMGCIS